MTGTAPRIFRSGCLEISGKTAVEIVHDEITKMEVGNENDFQVKVLDVVVRVNDAILSGSFKGGRAILENNCIAIVFRFLFRIYFIFDVGCVCCFIFKYISRHL